MLRRLLLALSLALAPCLAVGPAIAATSPPISCPPGSVPDPRTGQCRLVVSVPEEPGSPGQPGGGGTTQPVVVQKCLNSIESPPIEVPCASDDGWWSNGQNAYCKVRVPQPPPSDPVWEGHTDGQVRVPQRLESLTRWGCLLGLAGYASQWCPARSGSSTRPR